MNLTSRDREGAGMCVYWPVSVSPSTPIGALVLGAER
jgi:hypothetical protein